MKDLNNDTVAALFKTAFGHAPDAVTHAPGRVNVIGEHTDYNHGFVLPAAINFGTWVALSPRNDQVLQAVAHDFDDAQVTVDLQQPQRRDPEAPWSDYLRGVVAELQARGFNLRGGNLLISGNVPSGAGLSSSASLEMALIRAMMELSGTEIDPTDAALVGQAAENDFVGCACGIMDQLISARGQANSALLIDCRDLTSRSIAMPEHWRLLIVHSGVRRGLVESEYNLRRQQCEAAATFFGRPSLREVTLSQLADAAGKLDEQTYRRARHVLTENARTVRAAAAMETNRLDQLVRVMADSHASMRDDFEITTPEIDTLVAIMQRAGQGEAGVRMTGGGFGGCVIAVAPEGVIPQLEAAVLAEYQAATGCAPMLIPAKASAGAFCNDIARY